MTDYGTYQQELLHAAVEAPSVARSRAFADFMPFRVGRLRESDEYLRQLRNILDEYAEAIDEELAHRQRNA